MCGGSVQHYRKWRVSVHDACRLGPDHESSRVRQRQIAFEQRSSMHVSARRHASVQKLFSLKGVLLFPVIRICLWPAVTSPSCKVTEGRAAQLIVSTEIHPPLDFHWSPSSFCTHVLDAFTA